MTALWILLGIFLFFFVLFHIPLHVRVGIEESLFVYIKVLFIKIPIMPKPQKTGKKRKKKKKKSEDQEASKEKKKPKQTKKQGKKDGKKDDKKEKPKKKMNIKALIVAVLRVLRAFFKKFGKHFKVRIYAYEVMVATGDAATTSTLYGTIYGLSRMIFSLLNRTKMVKVKRNATLGVYPDFLGEAPKAHVDIDLSITLHGVFAMLLAAGFAFVKAIPTLWNEAPKEENEEEKKKDEETSETKTISETENGEETKNNKKK